MARIGPKRHKKCNGLVNWILDVGLLVFNNKLETNSNSSSSSYYYYYLLQLGCYPVAVVILHVNKT